MKIECAWCERNLGEKCPACGSHNVRQRTGGKSFFTHFACDDCDERFLAGEGGVSSTVCDDCREKEFRNLPGRLSAEEIIARAEKAGR